MKNKITTITAAFAAGVLLNAFSATAQDAPPPPPPGAPPPPAQGDNQGPGGRRGNMQDFMQRMNERVKTALKATDEEWAVIQPLLEKVQTAQRETMAGRFGGFGRRGGGGPGGQPGGGQQGGQPADQNQRGPGGPGGPGGFGGGSPESQALRTTLDNENASPEEIKTKLAALRESRKKAQEQLESAREDLKKVLTLRQEAVLVQMGLLD